MDMFFLRKEFFEAEAEILRIAGKHHAGFGVEDDEDIGGEALVEAAKELTDEGIRLNSKIKYVLSHYEILLYGVKTGRFDEGFIEELAGSRVIGHYKVLKPYIEDIKKKYNFHEFMEHFEEYALKWQSGKWQPNPEKKKSKMRYHRQANN